MSELQSKFKYNNIDYLIEIKKLDKYNFANLFHVAECGENSYYNISRTMRFDNMDSIPESMYQTYEIHLGDTWTNISFKFFKTIKLWWLICKFNNIINPFAELIPGKFIKIPSESIVEMILDAISE
jgi:vacuolar-type H+-ATPase subunit C/Vma6